jgi:hypothetical protein
MAAGSRGLPTTSGKQSVESSPRWPWARRSTAPPAPAEPTTLAPSTCELELCDVVPFEAVEQTAPRSADPDDNELWERWLRMGAFVGLLLLQYVVTRMIAQAGLPSDGRRVWLGGDLAGATLVPAYHAHRVQTLTLHAQRTWGISWRVAWQSGGWWASTAHGAGPGSAPRLSVHSPSCSSLSPPLQSSAPSAWRPGCKSAWPMCTPGVRLHGASSQWAQQRAAQCCSGTWCSHAKRSRAAPLPPT